MKSYTAGPWEDTADGSVWSVSMEDDTPYIKIADLHGDNSDNPRLPTESQKVANARLVAVAPDMYELLEELAVQIESDNAVTTDSTLYKRLAGVLRYARGDGEE